MHLDSGLTRAISPTTLLYWFFFFSEYINVCSILISQVLSRCTLIKAHIDTSQRQYHIHIIWIWSSSVQLSSSYLIILIVCRVMFLLILIIFILTMCQLFVILISLLAPCILSYKPSYTSFFNSQLDRQRRFSFKRFQYPILIP